MDHETMAMLWIDSVKLTYGMYVIALQCNNLVARVK